jgi:CheY-like chemotaxis protein
MSRDVFSVRGHVDVESLLFVLRQMGLDGIPVVDDHGRLEGYVSLARVLRALDISSDAENGSLRARVNKGMGQDLGVGSLPAEEAPARVRDLMNPAPPKLPDATPIIRAASVMSFERVHHVPVVTEDNKLIGIVSALNVLEWLAQQDGYLVPLGHTREQTAALSKATRVLVADDDVDMRRLVAQALQKDGCEVIEVADGTELLDYVGSALMGDGHVARPDIIISDIRMPGFNGLQILAGLRNAKWDTPIILITAMDDQKTYADAARLGASALFQKPFDPHHLRRAVRDLVV